MLLSVQLVLLSTIYMSESWATGDINEEFPSYCSKNVAQHTIPSVDNVTNVELIQVQIILRHGARTPYQGGFCWEGYNETWNCNVKQLVTPEYNSSVGFPVFEKIYDDGLNELNGNCHIGQLLDEGFLQEQSNGKNFRAAYVGNTPLHLFTSDEPIDLANATDFHLESDDEDRTVMSGQIVMASMFPTRKDPSGIVPWHTGDIKTSPYRISTENCPQIDMISNEFQSSADFKTWNNSQEHQQLEMELDSTLKSYNTAALYDCFMTSRCSGFDLPVSDELFDRVTERYEETQRRMYLYNNSIYSKTVMASFTTLLRDRINDRINQTKQGPRFALYSGHDTTIAPLLAAIGGSDWYSSWIPYAAYLSIELYHAANASEEYFFRAVYQGLPLNVSGCDQTLCPISIFLNATSFATDPSLCNATAFHSSGELTLSTDKWLIVTLLALVVGVFGGVCSAFFFFRRNSGPKDANSERTLLKNDGTADDSDTHSESPGTVMKMDDVAIDLEEDEEIQVI